MDKANYFAEQQHIINTLEVSPSFDAQAEIARRTDFLCNYLIQTGCRSYVLGISGGVDSLTAGLLAQAAVKQARKRNHDAVFIAMRLPYGTQKDEQDAQHSLDVIRPDQVLTVDIKPASDAMLTAVKSGGQAFHSVAQEDFILGNIKARQRMIAQYAVAGTTQGLVIGTDQAAEALMGFFTKFGDGACDLTPLTGLNKRRVRALAKEMGAPDSLVHKVPTADLENLAPLKPDEAAFGISYEEIDDFLEGKPVSEQAYDVIFKQYRLTAHKRAMPFNPFSG
jgi:NAD+ synthase